MKPQKLFVTALALAASFVSGLAMAQTSSAPGACPQPRFTGKAPPEYYDRKSPLQATPENQKAGEQLFLGSSDSESCAICHGRKGDGKGVLSGQYDPPPRNFVCANTINGVPDGQLFWIIRYGSPGTSMPPHSKFSDEQIWRIISHLRQLAK